MKDMSIVIMSLYIGTACIASESGGITRTASESSSVESAGAENILMRSVSVGQQVSRAGIPAPAPSLESVEEVTGAAQDEEQAPLRGRHASVTSRPTSRPGAAQPQLVRDGGRINIRRGGLGDLFSAETSAAITGTIVHYEEQAPLRGKHATSAAVLTRSSSDTLGHDSDSDDLATQPLESGHENAPSSQQ